MNQTLPYTRRRVPSRSLFACKAALRWQERTLVRGAYRQSWAPPGRHGRRANPRFDFTTSISLQALRPARACGRSPSDRIARRFGVNQSQHRAPGQGVRSAACLCHGDPLGRRRGMAAISNTAIDLIQESDRRLGASNAPSAHSIVSTLSSTTSQPIVSIILRGTD